MRSRNLSSGLDRLFPYWVICGLLVLAVAASGCSAVGFLSPEEKSIYDQLMAVEDDPATPEDEQQAAMEAADVLVSDATERQAGGLTSLITAFIPAAAPVAGALYGAMNLLSPRVRQNSGHAARRAGRALKALAGRRGGETVAEASASITALLASVGLAHTDPTIRPGTEDSDSEAEG